MCTTGSSALVCEGGTWKAYDCPGPFGCATNRVETVQSAKIDPKPTFNTGFICDWRSLSVGSECPVVDTRILCGLDGGTYVQCLLTGRLTEVPCARCDWFDANIPACY